MRHVVFRVNRERYALALSAVREVVESPDWLTAVPRGPDLLHGVMNLRGRIVPLVSLAKLLSVRDDAANGNDRVVLLDRGRRELGLCVSDIEGVENIERMSSGADARYPYIKGVARLGAIAVTVLDPDGIDSAIAEAFLPN